MEKAAARRLLFKIQGQNQRYMSGGQHRGAGLSARGDENCASVVHMPAVGANRFLNFIHARRVREDCAVTQHGQDILYINAARPAHTAKGLATIQPR
jgi:hypothetical protein